jgi:transposase
VIFCDYFGDFMLNTKQTKAVAMLFDGKNQKSIATILKVHENTVSNWKKDPEFQRALQKLSDKYLAEQRAIMLKNQSRLALRARSEMVRFSATKDLLDRADIVADKLVQTISEEYGFADNGLKEAIENTAGVFDDTDEESTV